jgi:hypothetical protein
MADEVIVPDPGRDSLSGALARQLMRWKWALCLIAFAAAVTLKFNGSSIGEWSRELNESAKPNGLLLFSPQHARQDEWTLWTPAALSQARQTPSFPTANYSLGAGRSPLLLSLPVAYYTTVFRPQLWGFFLFDFERGFSFFWCTKQLALLLACAWMLRKIGIQSRVVVCLGTLWIFFSAYVQWWFSTPAMLPEMIASWAICIGCVVVFFQSDHWWKIALAVAGFVFCGINFLLCLYPPYEIPLLLLGLALLFGSVAECAHTSTALRYQRGALLLGASILIIALLLIPFWWEMHSTFDLVRQTFYPGSRRSNGGDLSFFKLFSGLFGFFQTEKTTPSIYPNICEASNFFPLWPAAVIGMAIYRREKIRVSFLAVAVVILLSFLLLYCLLPMPRWLLNGTLLSFATESRALLAIGLANIILCCVFFDRWSNFRLARIGAIALVTLFCLAIASIWWWAKSRSPEIFPDPRQLALALSLSALIFAVFFLKPKFALWLLALLMIASNSWINPVMRGLAPLTDSEAFKTIEKLHADDPLAKWAVYHDYILGGVVLATGAPVLNAYKIVPDLDFMHRLDPTRAGEWVYNRYAYIACEFPQNNSFVASLLNADLYSLSLPPNLPLLREIGCRYILSSEQWPDADDSGFFLVRRLSQSNIWIYQRRVTLTGSSG